MIDPNLIEIATVPQLPAAPFALSNLIPHSTPGGILGKGNTNDFISFIAPYISAVGGSSYVNVTGLALPTPASDNNFAIVKTGTYTHSGGNVNATGDINILNWNGTIWSLANSIDINLDDYSTILRSNNAYYKNKNAIVNSKTNIFDKEKILQGFFINQADGTLISNPAWFVSDYIPVNVGQDYSNLGYYAFYAENKGFISGGLNGSEDIKVKAPSNSVYMRISSPDPLVTYKVLTDAFVINPTSKNLFDKDAAIIGYLVESTTGNLSVNPAWFSSEYIPVVAGTRYFNLGFFAWYDLNKNFISGGNSSVGGVLAPVNAYYLRVSTAVDLDTYQVEVGSSATSFADYGYKLELVKNKETINTYNTDKTNVIVVRAGGTIGVNCDFTDIKSALDSITDNSKNNRYKVSVKNGTYDISSQTYKYLGLKNYVSIVGQSLGGTIIINRKATFDNDNAGFDTAFYHDAIEYACIDTMTIIAFNGKGPVHVDSGYNDLISGGTIEVKNVIAINENTFGMTHYQVGVACGLRDGQRVVCKNVNSNGRLWVHSVNQVSETTGCTFELYGCTFPWTEVADVYTYAKDTFIMKGCKTLYLMFSVSDPFTFDRGYNQFSYEAELEGNDIGYILGYNYADPNNRNSLWDNWFGGRFGIHAAEIHNFCKNNTSSTIARGSLVKLAGNQNELKIEPWTFGSVLYGQALDGLLSNSYGLVQYSGVIFLNSSGSIAVNDVISLDSAGTAIKSTANPIGISLDAVTSGGEIRVKLNK